MCCYDDVTLFVLCTDSPVVTTLFVAVIQPFQKVTSMARIGKFLKHHVVQPEHIHSGEPGPECSHANMLFTVPHTQVERAERQRGYD